MAWRRIKVNADSPAQRIGCVLDGERWTLRLRLNVRAARYVLDVYDAAGELQLSGVMVSTLQPLLHQYRNGRSLPKGELVAFDFSGGRREAGPDIRLGRDVQLFYLDEVRA